jgi:hypothetical protein
MDRRTNYSKVAPEGIRAPGGLEIYLWGTGYQPRSLAPAATESRMGATA